MAKINLLRDQSGAPLQALRLSGVRATATTTGVSATLALPAGLVKGEVARISATKDCYIEFGTAGVTATTSSTLFPAGVEYLVTPPEVTHIAVLQVAESGRFQIEEAI